MTPKLAVVLGLVLLVVIGFAFHWWVIDVRRIWDWLVYAEPADLPGQGAPAPLAGEHHPSFDEWDQLDPDEAADVWVAELHDEEPLFLGHDLRECGEHRTVGPHRAWCFDCTEWCYPNDGCKGCRLMGAPDITRAGERAWWDDPDLVVWDAKRQAARCWEILHVEFPRLRAELCGVAA